LILELSKLDKKQKSNQNLNKKKVEKQSLTRAEIWRWLRHSGQPQNPENHRKISKKTIFYLMSVERHCVSSVYMRE